MTKDVPDMAEGHLPRRKITSDPTRRSSRARGEEEARGSWGRRKEAARRRMKVVLSEEEQLFKFLNEGQNGPFNKLLGAPAILLGAPSMSPG